MFITTPKLATPVSPESAIESSDVQTLFNAMNGKFFALPDNKVTFINRDLSEITIFDQETTKKDLKTNQNECWVIQLPLKIREVLKQGKPCYIYIQENCALYLTELNNDGYLSCSALEENFINFIDEHHQAVSNVLDDQSILTNSLGISDQVAQYAHMLHSVTYTLREFADVAKADKNTLESLKQLKTFNLSVLNTFIESIELCIHLANIQPDCESTEQADNYVLIHKGSFISHLKSIYANSAPSLILENTNWEKVAAQSLESGKFREHALCYPSLGVVGHYYD